jgi:hypothetical protein
MANKLYDIEDSQTGKVYTIEGPEGATAEELGSFIQSQDTPATALHPEVSIANPAQPVAATPTPAGSSGPLTSPDKTVVVNGFAPEQKRLTPEAESAVAEAAANPNVSWEDYNNLIKQHQTEAGIPALGSSGNEGQLQAYRNGLASGKITKQGVTYHNVIQDVLPTPTPNADVEKDPGIIETILGGLIDPSHPLAGRDTLHGIARGAQAAGHSPATFFGWLDRLNSNWMDDGGAMLRQKFPGLTDENYADLRHAYVGWKQKEQDAANQQEVSHDAIAPNFVGQLVGSSGPELAVPGFGEEGLMARAAVSAATGMGANAAYQGLAVHDQAQDHFDPEQVAEAGLMTGALHLAGEGVHAILPKGSEHTPVGDSAAPQAPEPIRVPSSFDRRTKAYREGVRDAQGGIIDNINHLTKDWTNAPKYEVHENFNNLPGVDPTAIGAYGEDGRVLINTHRILDEVKTRNDAGKETTPENIVKAVTYHEGLGHHGLAQKFGDDLDAVMQDLYDNGLSTFKQDIDDRVAKTGETIPLAVEETLAEKSEKGTLPNTFKDRVNQLISSFARKIGLKTSYNEDDIKAILDMAHSAVIGGKGRDVVANGFKSMVVYHGSPHDFDEFDHSKIGTGEGAQAYGHGTYLTESEKIAQGYRDRLARDGVLEYNHPDTGEKKSMPMWAGYNHIEDELGLPIGDDHKQEVYPATYAVNEIARGHSLEEAIANAHEQYAHFPDQEAVSRGLERVRKSGMVLKNKGKLYHVEIPEDAKWLHWDKPLKDQDLEVRQRLAKFGLDGPETDHFTGEHAYRLLAAEAADKNFQGGSVFKLEDDYKGASDTLHEAGITGIKYRDGFSRHKNQDILDEIRRQEQIITDHERDKKFIEESGYSDEEDNPAKSQKAIDYHKSRIDELKAQLRPDTHNYVVFHDKTPKIVKKYMKDFDGEERRKGPRVDSRMVRRDQLMRRANDREKLRDEYRQLREKGIDPRTVGLPDNPNSKFMKEFTPEEDEEFQTVAQARRVLSSSIKNYNDNVKIVRSWGEAKEAARERGIAATDIKNAKKLGVEAFDKKLFQYDAALEHTNDRIAKLNEQMMNEGYSEQLKQKYLEALTEFHYMLGKVWGHQAEVARALNAMKQLDYTKNKFGKLNELLYKHEDHMLSGFADENNFQDFANTVKYLLDTSNTAGAASMMRQVFKPYWWEYVLSFRHAEMLSGLGTQAKNAKDNAIMLFRDLEEKGMALPLFYGRKGLNALGIKTKEGVSPEEIVGHTYGMFQALIDSGTYTNTAKAFWEGPGNRMVNVKLEHEHARIPVLSKVGDTLYAADTFFRSFNMNANLYALGVRKAREMGFTGKTALEEGANLGRNPTLDMIEDAKKLSDTALLVDTPSALTGSLEAAKSIKPNMGGGAQAKAFGANLLFPFLRVTDRTLFAAIRRSPLSFMDKNTREDFLAGGARRDIAIARTTYGTALIAYYWYRHNQGATTGNGPTDYNKVKALQGGGWKANSVVKDGKYVDATALNLSFLPQDLQNNTAATVASLADAWNRGTKDGHSASQIAAGIGLAAQALGTFFVGNSFANNISQYTEPFQRGAGNDLTTTSANVASGFANSFIPAGLRQYNQAIHDPIQRDTKGDKSFGDQFMGKIEDGIPGLSDNLPEKYDVYGDPMERGRSISGIGNYQTIKTDPVSVELQRLERTTDKPVVGGAPSSFHMKDLEGVQLTTDSPYFTKTKEGTIADDDGKVTLSAKGRQEWQRVQGYYIREQMRRIITTPGWKTLPDKDKIIVVKQVKRDSSQAAKEYLLPSLAGQDQEE